MKPFNESESAKTHFFSCVLALSCWKIQSRSNLGEFERVIEINLRQLTNQTELAARLSVRMIHLARSADGLLLMNSPKAFSPKNLSFIVHLFQTAVLIRNFWMQIRIQKAKTATELKEFSNWTESLVAIRLMCPANAIGPIRLKLCCPAKQQRD